MENIEKLFNCLWAHLGFHRIDFFGGRIFTKFYTNRGVQKGVMEVALSKLRGGGGNTYP